MISVPLAAVALIPLFVRRVLGVNIIMRCSHFMRLCLTDSQRDEFIIALHALSLSLSCVLYHCAASSDSEFPLESWTVGAGRACLIIIAFCWRKERKHRVMKEWFH